MRVIKKELINPIDVYKEVEDILTESGDIHRFKDWTTKIRNNSEYHKQNHKERQINKEKIDIKKTLYNQFVKLNNILDIIDYNFNIINNKEDLKTKFTQYKRYEGIYLPTVEINYIIYDIVQTIKTRSSIYDTKNDDISELYYSIELYNILIEKSGINLYGLFSKYMYEEMSTEGITKLEQAYKEYNKLINEFRYKIEFALS